MTGKRVCDRRTKKHKKCYTLQLYWLKREKMSKFAPAKLHINDNEDFFKNCTCRRCGPADDCL